MGDCIAELPFLFASVDEVKSGRCRLRKVQKKDLTMQSLYDKIPGIEYSEREMHEMLGVSFEGLPDQSLVFLPENWDEKVHPWRRDDSGLSPKHIRELS